MRPLRRDEIDRAIILELVQNPRQSNVAIAKTLEISEGSVRRRVDSLIAEGNIAFSVVPRPAFMGLPVHTLFNIQSVPGHNDELVEQIRSMPEISYVYHVTGQFDIIAVGYFASNEDMGRFQTEKLGRLPGIMESRSLMVIRVAKRQHEWGRAVTSGDHAPELDQTLTEHPASVANSVPQLGG